MKKQTQRFMYCMIGIIFCSIFLSACVGQKNIPTGKIGSISPDKALIDYEPHEVCVMFINVGKADSVLIQIDDKAYLIDTGDKISVPALYSALSHCGVKTLDGVFLTHAHGDHIGGLTALSQKYAINVLYSPTILENNAKQKITELANNLSLNLVNLDASNTIEIIDDIYFEVLAPLLFNETDDNDNSLVLKLSVNGRTFLFTGDMQFPEEDTLLNAGVPLSANVLKVGNHGNDDSTSSAFAKAVSPEIAIISTDTSVDTNSANIKVINSLSDSDVHITEDFDLGVLLNVNKDNSIDIMNPERSDVNADLDIESVNKETQTVELTNKGEEIDVSGYFIFSTKGSEVFVFPEGSILAAGQSITIADAGNNVDYIWDEKKVWNKKKEDIAMLYDNFGNLLSEFTSE